MDVVAVVATSGNVAREVAAANVLRVLHAAGRPEVPVALGAAAAGPAAGGHGADGLGGTAARWTTGGRVPRLEPGEELVARLATERPGELDLVTIGPLSTLAAALGRDAGVAGRFRSLTVLGGALGAGGRARPPAETNVAHDPSAAARVVAAPWTTGAPPLLVGLDVTRTTLLGPAELALAAEGRTPAARFVAGPLERFAARYAASGTAPAGRVPCHDLLAVVAAVEPAVITDAPAMPLAVDAAGVVARAAASGAPRPAAWRVALAADGERFRGAFRRLVAPGG